jgi:hypothetical protein
VEKSILTRHRPNSVTYVKALRATSKVVDVTPVGALYPCEGCALAKAKSKGIPKVSTNQATMPGQRLCTDISSPYKKSIIASD